MGLHQGTINILVEAGTPEGIRIPPTKVPGCDPIDVDQDFLVRPCVLNDTDGYQILPVTRSTGTLAGHHAEGIIEIALVKKIPLEPRQQLEVKLLNFD